jgi:hypothetical protein
MRKPRQLSAAVAPATHPARSKGQRHQRKMNNDAQLLELKNFVPLLRGHVGASQHLPNKIRILAAAQDLVSRGDVTGERKRRQQQGKGEQIGPPIGIPGLGAEPKMNTDTSMGPDREYRD